MDLELGVDIRPAFNLRQQLWGRLSWAQVVRFFAACATPIHIWAIIMVLRDLSWVSGRTNAWDGIGLVAYALLFALLESLVVFAGFYLLSWLAPWSWTGDVLLTRMTAIVWVFQVWAVLGQLVPLVGGGMFLPLQFLLYLSLALRLLYMIIAVLAMLSLLLPVFLLDRFPRFEKGLLGLLDRVVILMAIYLVLDLVGIVIILLRNT